MPASDLDDKIDLLIDIQRETVTVLQELSSQIAQLIQTIKTNIAK